MKSAFVAAGLCASLAVIVLAAQNRGFGSNGPVGRLALALDTDHDGVISASEIRSATAALKTLDINHDGQLTADELRPDFGGRGGPREEGQPASSPDDLTETLMAFDRNGDGKLDRSEVPERFQGLFNRADANKDGSLTRDELQQSATSTVPQDAGRGRRGGREGGFGRGGMFDPLMRALDTDGDGVLSEAEIAGAARALEALDADRDGQLSGSEFRPAPPRGPGGREGRRH